MKIIGRLGIEVAQFQVGKGKAGAVCSNGAENAGVGVVGSRTGQLISVPYIQQAVFLRAAHRDGRNAAVKDKLHLRFDVVGSPQRCRIDLRL